MKLRCVKCGRIVSGEIPDGTKVSAWIECRCCVNKEVFSNKVKFDDFTLHGIRLKATKFYKLCKYAELDFDKVDEIFKKARHLVESGQFPHEQDKDLLAMDEVEI